MRAIEPDAALTTLSYRFHEIMYLYPRASLRNNTPESSQSLCVFSLTNLTYQNVAHICPKVFSAIVIVFYFSLSVLRLKP